MDREKVIKGLKWFRDRDSWREGIMIHDDHAEVRKRICDDALALLKEDCHNCKLECLLQKYDELKEKYDALLKEQEDLGTELTNAMELIHKKNERIKKLEEQIETLTKWRANAGAFD